MEKTTDTTACEASPSTEVTALRSLVKSLRSEIRDLKKRLNGKPLSRRLRFRILERDRFRCVYCGRGSRDIRLTVDHLTPRADGGGSVPGNLVTACVECNLGKGAIPISTKTLPARGALRGIYGPYPVHGRDGQRFRVEWRRGTRKTSKTLATEADALAFIDHLTRLTDVDAEAHIRERAANAPVVSGVGEES